MLVASIIAISSLGVASARPIDRRGRDEIETMYRRMGRWKWALRSDGMGSRLRRSDRGMEWKCRCVPRSSGGEKSYKHFSLLRQTDGIARETRKYRLHVRAKKSSDQVARSEESMTDKKPDGGPAFPTVELDGMSLRQYAVIKLRVPDSGVEWLDEMIRTSLRDQFAGQVVNGILSVSPDQNVDVTWANMIVEQIMKARSE